jgi:hypothetical protein
MERYDHHPAVPSALVASSGSQFFGTAGGDGVVQVWDL